jgi:SAM-dependent methyltransferase
VALTRAGAKRALMRSLPPAWRTRARRLRRPARLGSLRRTTPLSDAWGRDRGTPVDRYYIESFLSQHAGDIRGDVLELLDSGYADRFGRGVSKCDVLDIDRDNPRATVIADLAAADAIAVASYDCFILTQTLQFIYDVRAAVSHAHRILRPGGVVLCTVPSVSRVARRHLESEHWRFTVASCTRLFGDVFGPGAVEVRSYGNVLACVSFLAGLAAEELSQHELDEDDPFFPLLIAVRAVRDSPGNATHSASC